MLLTLRMISGGTGFGRGLVGGSGENTKCFAVGAHSHAVPPLMSPGPRVFPGQVVLQVATPYLVRGVPVLRVPSLGCCHAAEPHSHASEVEHCSLVRRPWAERGLAVQGRHR